MLIGIDTGGTFTDVVALSEGKLQHFKLPSSSSDPAAPVIEGIERISRDKEPSQIIHGSTVATNAVLERKGALTALLTTSGFEDMLQIARQTRPELYNLRPAPLRPLILQEHCFGISERISAEGEVLIRPERSALKEIAGRFARAGIEAVAICFLHCYANDENERAVADFLRKEGFDVTASSEILPEYREYERCSTTAINAFLRPVLDRYYGRLEQNLAAGSLQIMQSSGGSISSQTARISPVRTVLSGPAGGVVAAREIGRLAGFDNLITLDMGGTSTDVAIIKGDLPLTTEGAIDDLPIKLPMTDIVTVGAGGGSIARLDIGGALRVGPQSAGADPGPICYGKGEELTVTDAHLFLGQIPADQPLGGVLWPDLARTKDWFLKHSKEFGLEPAALAEGILKVAAANMERALRVVSVQRGHDPRDFCLFAFGGAGGLHACRLAESLKIGTVIIPYRAGVISALGMLLADVVKDYSATVFTPGDELDSGALDREFAPLLEKAVSDMAAEGIGETRIALERSVAMRYRGQSYELHVPYGPKLIERFHELHYQRYGHSDPERRAEVVNIIVRAVGMADKPQLERFETKAHRPTGKKISLTSQGSNVEAIQFPRSELSAGAELTGPALVYDIDSTALIRPGWTCRVDGWLNLIMERQ